MKGFFKTVAIVTVFSVCEKFLGFIYRIYMSQTIGSEGVGLYQVALSVFAFLLTVTCSGTPITVSRLITKYYAENRKDKVYKVITAGLCFTLLIAVPVCLVMLLLSDKLSFIFADPRCKEIFYIILPGLIFTSIYSIIRGVFWGTKDFLPYSIIELLEEVCMIIVGIILMSQATSAHQGAYYAGIAVLISYIFSFTLSVIMYFVRKNKLANPKTQFKPLIASAAPVTAMRTINSLAVSLVSIILPMRLVSAGYTESTAISLFGAAAGQAIPLLFIPTTLIGSFTLVLVPEIAENYYKNNHTALKIDIEKSMKFTTVLTSLFVPVFMALGNDVGVIVFSSPECGDYLVRSAFLMIFMSISSLSTSILNSIGCENKALVYVLVSGAFMMLAIWFLPAVFGIYALLIGFAFVYIVTSLLNLRLIRKKCKDTPKLYLPLIISSALILPTTFMGVMLKKLIVNLLGTLLSAAVCAVVMLTFQSLLLVGLGLIDISLIKQKFKIKKRARAN